MFMVHSLGFQFQNKTKKTPEVTPSNVAAFKNGVMERAVPSFNFTVCVLRLLTHLYDPCMGVSSQRGALN